MEHLGIDMLVMLVVALKQKHTCSDQLIGLREKI